MPVKFAKKATKVETLQANDGSVVGHVVVPDTGAPTPAMKKFESVHHADKTVTHKNESKPMVFAEPPCVVTMTGGQTINIGNYSSVRFDVGLSMPCKPSEVESTYEFIKGWIDMRLMELQKEVKPSTE